jgi:hypothetical protein
MSHDSTREVRAMVLLTLPCPPMPMLMSKEIIDETSFTHAANVPGNSHDLLAHLLNKAAAAKACGVKLHPKRRVYQQLATNLLNKRFDDWKLAHPQDALPTLEISYGYFAEFSRAYIQSFMEDPEKALDIRFVPACDMDSGGMIHKKSLDFAKAQNVLFGKISERNVEAMAYPEFIQLSAQRMLLTEQSVLAR